MLACDSYSWIDGNTYTSSNSMATYLMTTSSGCDSLISLDLTISSSSSTIDVIDKNSYTWIDEIHILKQIILTHIHNNNFVGLV